MIPPAIEAELAAAAVERFCRPGLSGLLAVDIDPYAAELNSLTASLMHILYTSVQRKGSE